MAVTLDDFLPTGNVEPPRIVLYGVEGIGKTCIAANAPNPIFIQTEDGVSGSMPDGTPVLTHINQNGGAVLPLATSYDDVRGVLAALASDDHDHAFKTLVVDSLDWLEPLIWKKVVADNPLTDKGKPVSSIEDYGFGKGYGLALNIWTDFKDALAYLRAHKGMSVVLLAHHEVKRFDDPSTEPYDRYQPKLHKAANAKMKEWADCILFANYRVSTTQVDTGFNNTKTRAIGSGDRLLFTEERPAFIAKNRFAMPAEIALDWNALSKTIPFFSSNQAPAPAVAAE